MKNTYFGVYYLPKAPAKKIDPQSSKFSFLLSYCMSKLGVGNIDLSIAKSH